MADPRSYGAVSFALRVFILLLAIISMILILTAPGACFSRYLNGQAISREICPGQNSIFPMNADRWNNALHFQGRGQNVYGQVAIIVISLFLGMATCALSCLNLAVDKPLTYPQMCASGFCVLSFLALGGIETWYATGFDHMAFFIQAIGNGVFSGCAGLPGCQIQFVIKGWAVAAVSWPLKEEPLQAFYFLSAVLYLMDMVVVFLRRDSEPGNRVVLKSNASRISI